jgi:hypothetical protein
MTSLLNTGFDIISTETMVTLTGGVVVEELAAITASDSAYMAYYLKKGPSLYRCTEEGEGAAMVYCWEFSPKIGKINGLSQQDLPLNPLLGRWSGAAIATNGKMTGVSFTFTDAKGSSPGTMEASFPDLPREFPVTYDVQPSSVTVTPTNGNNYLEPMRFELKGGNRATLTTKFGGTTSLQKDEAASSGTPR